MRTNLILSRAFTLLAIAVLVVAYAVPARADTVTRTISSSGVVTFPTSSDVAPVDASGPELDAPAGDSDPESNGTNINRTIATGTSQGHSVNAGKKAKSSPELVRSFNGINFFEQRFVADGGNQLSVEPPDQALCVGNGFVLESVNDTIRVFDTNGTALTTPASLNQFYGYPHAIDRAPGHGNARGPAITDPVCHFDRATGRFFHVVLTLEVAPTTGARLGPNHLDIAVSNTSDPRATWTIYKIPTQNDGTQGTPDHGCIRSGGAHGPCLADFPHIGADRNGIYITTNEFSFFGPGFKGADIYALPKAGLVAGAATVPLVLIETRDFPAVPGQPGFTVWPAITPGDQFSDDAGGTEYFVSSNAVFADDDTSSQLIVWAVSNTSSLSTVSPALTLTSAVVAVAAYGVPARSTQKTGSVPTADCLNDPTCRPFLTSAPFTSPAVEGKLDSSDSRVLGVTYANGKLWSVLGTSAIVAGTTQAAAAWYVLRPSNSAGLSASVGLQGTLALAATNLIYPTIAVNQSGRGVIGFTLVGPNDFPSAGYAAIDGAAGTGDVHIAAAGVGPQDGFTEYPVLSGQNRPRWGDYGAAVVDGKSIWIASEYIAQTCTLAQYRATPFGRCGNTRGSLGNWATRITQINP